MRRAFAVLLVGTLAVGACGRDEPSPAVPNTAPPDILMVGAAEQVQAQPRDAAGAEAFDSAMALAVANGADLGYPWIDPATGQLVVTVTTTQGRILVEHTNPGVPFQIRMMQHGVAELEKIKDEATTLSGSVPGAELIYATQPDHRDNRVLLVIQANSDALIRALAARFPSGTLAIQVKSRT